MTQPPVDPPHEDPWAKPTPPVEPPPAYGPPGYGPPGYGPPGYGPPGYGPPPPYGYLPPGYGYVRQNHAGATTAMWLGIVGLGCLFTGWLCCITLPGVLALPVAWGVGYSAKRAIDAEPGRYGNRGQAVGGLVMGIVGTVLAVLVVVALVVLFVVAGDVDTDPTLYGNV
ncbi:hypothetical protein NOCA2420045 [metagenome]|uniref:DUF4190 domain-containing protein n=1 Tax=metagenome TaxID=256318 RepID=A0A2P2C651_9ZZZZ